MTWFRGSVVLWLLALLTSPASAEPEILSGWSQNNGAGRILLGEKVKWNRSMDSYPEGVQNGVEVRLWGIETPEEDDICIVPADEKTGRKREDWPCGITAKWSLDPAAGTKSYLHKVECRVKCRKAGEIIARCGDIRRRKGPEGGNYLYDLAWHMIREAVASPLPEAPKAYHDMAAEVDARRKKKGIGSYGWTRHEPGRKASCE